jgi:Family of unknown function (DUF5681)
VKISWRASGAPAGFFAPFWAEIQSEDQAMSQDDDEKLNNNTTAGPVVGYKRPPQHTRFKPGTSGNPSGCPKRKASFARELAEELAEQIVIREGEVTVRITRMRALLKRFVAKAMEGDPKMARLLVDLSEKQPATEDADAVADDDEVFINQLVAEKVDSEPGDE